MTINSKNVIELNTKTYLYVFPFLGISKSELHPFDKINGRCSHITAFLGVEEFPEYHLKICVLLKYLDKRFNEIDKIFTRHNNYIISYEPDSHHTMYIFDIPDTHKDSFNHFINGRYSMIHEEHKKQIIAFHSHPPMFINSKGKEISAILRKDEGAYLRIESALGGIMIPRHQEAESIVNIERNTYKNEWKGRKALVPREEWLIIKEEENE